MAQTTQPEFSKWRARLWPVHNFELKKLVPMLLLFFLIVFNYTILRDTKDTLIVTAPNSGAETITFLKVWGVLPMATLFMLGYAKLSNILSKQKLFYTTVSIFIGFFALFNFVLYPYQHLLHPNELADRLQQTLPNGCMGLIAIFRNWTYSLFYIMSELWGSMAVSLLFWGFANDITKVSESKRFYSLFGTGANCALLLSGPTIVFFSKIRDKIPAGIDAWQVTLNYLMSFVIIAGLLIMAIYWWMDRNVLTDPRFYKQEDIATKKKKKPKLSLKESFSFLIRSKYIGYIAILVIAYGIAMNLIEVTWKGQLKLQYPNSNDYSAFMGYFSTFGGIINVFTSLFIGGNIIRRFGWGKAALITPVMILATGVAFFSFIIFKGSLGGMIGLLGTTPLFLAVIIGMIQNILSKSAKYALFDPTKEMAYIPLDQESKIKGKAAIDVVGARLGKSGGALIQQGLIVSLGSLAAITPYIAVILFIIIGGWILSAKALNKEFTILSAKEDAKATKDQPEPALANS